MPTDTYNASTTWTCPANVTTVQIECWGGGASGKNGDGTSTGGKGGGGGAYSKTNTYAVTPGNNYTVTVGTAGASNGGAGGDSWFDSATGVCLAKGGTNTAGGLASGGVGDVKKSGGNGGNGSVTAGGGGGGSSGGTSADGNNGANGGLSAGGAGGTAPTGGGAGGDGGYDGGVGLDGTAPGGGGGGAGGNDVTPGGLGKAGRVSLTYTVGSSTASRKRVGAVGSLIFGFLALISNIFLEERYRAI